MSHLIDGDVISDADPLPVEIASSGVAVPISGAVTVTGTVSGTGTAGTAATGVVTVQGIASGVAVPVSDATADASLAAAVTGIGSLTEAAPATDTASSGLNGRLQRIAQRLTTAIALLPGFGTAGSPSANVVSTALLAVTACRLVKGQSVSEQITCTNATTDYPAAGAMPAGTKYLTVYCSSECAVAVGAATSTTNCYRQGAGQSVTYPTAVSGTAADDTVHVQSPTAGAVVTVTYGKD